MKKRGNGLKIWEFRYYEPLPEGNGRGLRAVTVGTLQDYPTETAARKSDAAHAISFGHVGYEPVAHEGELARGSHEVFA